MSRHWPNGVLFCCGILFTALTLLIPSLLLAARENRPFWTEKSAFVEGEDLFVVGVASKARSVEEGRRQAFEQGKVELMNYAQITSLEAQGLVVETRMTFEEPNADGTVTVYRLLRVPASKLVAIQDRLHAQSRTQEQALEQSQKQLATIQQTLAEKVLKLDQQQRQVEQMLQQLDAKLQLERTPGHRSESGASVLDHLRETETKLDAREQELGRLSRQVQERVKSSSHKACRYVTPGMTPSDVNNLLGRPDGERWPESYVTMDYNVTWAYGNTVVNFNDVGVVVNTSGCQR